MVLLVMACSRKPTTPPEVRFVINGQTWRSDLSGRPASLVVPAKVGERVRSIADNPWDVRDPKTSTVIAPFQAPDGTVSLLAFAAADAPPKPVTFDSASTDLWQKPLLWGVLSADGSLFYLSAPTGSFVAKRVPGTGLAFGPLRAVAPANSIVHDVSPDGRLAIVSGLRGVKWDSPGDVVAPRQMTLYTLKADGSFDRDVTTEHPPLELYVQSPTFSGDSAGLVYEGDDDIDTGDHLFSYRFGQPPKEVVPAPARDPDFNTPCVTVDGRIAFWESIPKQYLLRLHDPDKGTTTTLHDAWLPFTGYVRCR